MFFYFFLTFRDYTTTFIIQGILHKSNAVIYITISIYTVHISCSADWMHDFFIWCLKAYAV